MELTAAEAQRIVGGYHNDWETILDKPQSHGRWSVSHQAIFKHKPTGKFYTVWWSQGATENQMEDPFEYSDPVFKEVTQKEITKTIWVTVENNKEVFE